MALIPSTMIAQVAYFKIQTINCAIRNNQAKVPIVLLSTLKVDTVNRGDFGHWGDFGHATEIMLCRLRSFTCSVFQKYFKMFL